MKTALQDLIDQLDERLTEFEADGVDLNVDHEFIANLVGSDEVLRPTHTQLIADGFSGDPPEDGGWIYMHVWRPLTRSSVLQLAEQLDALAQQNRCLFELLDVTLTSGSKSGHIIILGACDGETLQNA